MPGLDIAGFFAENLTRTRKRQSLTRGSTMSGPNWESRIKGLLKLREEPNAGKLRKGC